MLRAQLIVDAAKRLLLVAVRRHVVGDLAARISAARQPFDDVQGRRTELRRIDLVVDVRRAQRHLTAAVARWRREVPQIAREHRRRRHIRDVQGGTLLQDGALIRAEEEEAVLHDRPTQCAPELVALEAIVQALAIGPERRERARRVEPMVAEELEAVA